MTTKMLFLQCDIECFPFKHPASKQISQQQYNYKIRLKATAPLKLWVQFRPWRGVLDTTL